MKRFDPHVCKILKYYVYRLIDPRNGETFYVGKGKNNRVFDHAEGSIIDEPYCDKIQRILAIQLCGLKVLHLIHRHGLDEKTAFEVEAALIDAYPGLTNISSGYGSTEYGTMHACEIIKKYNADTIEFRHKSLMINVNRSALEQSLYEATRFAWKLNPRKAVEAELVLSVVRGLVVGVFVADHWLEANTKNFPGKESIEGRYGFTGREAGCDIKKLYIGKKIPQSLGKRGASNPIRYSW